MNDEWTVAHGSLFTETMAQMLASATNHKDALGAVFTIRLGNSQHAGLEFRVRPVSTGGAMLDEGPDSISGELLERDRKVTERVAQACREQLAPLSALSSFAVVSGNCIFARGTRVAL